MVNGRASPALGAFGLRPAGIALALGAKDAAPIFVLSDGHPAFHTDTHALLGLGLPRKKLFQKRHGFSRFNFT
jgi:hypothetical protein